MTKQLMKGNEALAEAAVRAGCSCYYGYPITPQNEISQYLSWRMLEVGGTFIQAESEVASINMVYGSAGCGARVMTSSSSPGITLMQEGISYMAGSELPCVIVNMQRGGPGLGSINGAQSDYFQAVKGGGHGDYRLLVLAPATIQEIVNLTSKAFDLADKYRNPVMILGDGILGQMMEPVEFPDEPGFTDQPEKPWATTGAKGREPNVINSLYFDPEVLEQHNYAIQAKYKAMRENETMADSYLTEDAEIILVSYGSSARVCRAAVDQARALGIKAGLFRPITLYPFPQEQLQKACRNAQNVLTVEMGCGQLVEDVRYFLEFRVPVHFYGRPGGVILATRAVLAEVRRIVEKG